MIEINDVDLRSIALLDIGTTNLSSLKGEEYFLSVERYIKDQFNRRCSSKVISHIILTKSVFIMNYFAVFFDFENFKIFIESDDGNELYIKFDNENDLTNIMRLILERSKFDDDVSYDYEDFREESRKIFDNLDRYENKSYYDIWKDYIDLSIRWFS